MAYKLQTVCCIVMRYCIAGNFREVEIFTIFTIECQITKFLPPKIFAWQVEKAKHIAVKPRIWRQNWSQFVVETPSNLRKFCFGNCEWIFRVSLFPLAWQFITNSYSHVLISVLASYNHFNVVVQAWFPKQGRNFTRKIVGGMVLDRDQVTKLKIAKFFSWCVCWWFAKIYARENFLLYGIINI